MDSFTEDIWAMILVRLPQKRIITSKVVCKQWKSIVESPFLRKLFLSHNQNSHPSWSLMCKDHSTETVAFYGRDIKDHSRPLSCYIDSFVKDKFYNKKRKYKQATVVAYTDVGLVLIRVVSNFGNIVFYVANPFTRECVETDPPWFEAKHGIFILGIATRTENGVVSGYKVVLLYDDNDYSSFRLLIYSSETGLWSHETVRSPSYRHEFRNSISVNGNLHWLARNHLHDNKDEEYVVSIDFYGSDLLHCRVTPFPDLEKSPRYKRACTTSQGCLMYMNIIAQGNDNELKVWRLKSGGWQLVSEFSMKKGFEKMIPFAINPFDAETVYFWNERGHVLVSLNLRIGKFAIHGKVQRCDRILKCMKHTEESNFSSFVLPKWLHRIPNTVRSE